MKPPRPRKPVVGFTIDLESVPFLVQSCQREVERVTRESDQEIGRLRLKVEVLSRQLTAALAQAERNETDASLFRAVELVRNRPVRKRTRRHK